MADTTTKAGIHEIPARRDVPAANRWNLGKLSRDDASWDADLGTFEAMAPRIGAFQGTLGSSPESLYAALAFHKEYSMLDERLGYYAHLRQTEDEGDSGSRGRMSRFGSWAEWGANPNLPKKTGDEP